MAKRARRTYTINDKQKALTTLVANLGNITETAHQLDIPKSTLRRWRDQSQEIGFGEDLLHLARHIVTSMKSEAVHDKATMAQMATALRIVLDQYQALKQTEVDASVDDGLQIIIEGVQADHDKAADD